MPSGSMQQQQQHPDAQQQQQRRRMPTRSSARQQAAPTAVQEAAEPKARPNRRMGDLPHGEAQLSTANGHPQQLAAMLVGPDSRRVIKVQADERLLHQASGAIVFDYVGPDDLVQSITLITPSHEHRPGAFIVEIMPRVICRPTLDGRSSTCPVVAFHGSFAEVRAELTRLLSLLPEVRSAAGRAKLQQLHAQAVGGALQAAVAAGRQDELPRLASQLVSPWMPLLTLHYQGLRGAAGSQQPFAARRQLSLNTHWKGEMKHCTEALCLEEEVSAEWLPLPSYLPADKCHDSTPQAAAAAGAAAPLPSELSWTWLANEGVGRSNYKVTDHI